MSGRKRYIRLTFLETGQTSYIEPDRLLEILGTDKLPNLTGYAMSDRYMDEYQWRMCIRFEDKMP